MAELQWERRRPAQITAVPTSWLSRASGRFLDWEDWLTLALGLGAVLSVSVAVEQGGWTRDMPELSLVGVIALFAGLLLARSTLWIIAAWPLAAALGAAVCFWQTMNMVGAGSFEEKIDRIYFRFEAWFHLAFTGGISNDPLPFKVMVIGLTWAGVFVFGWSLYRWHNAWLGLIPGGIALFLEMLFIGESQDMAIFMYVLFGFLLIMRANMMARMRKWRSEGVEYPPFISLNILHYSVWAIVLLVVMTWLLPSRPFPTPRPVEALAYRLEDVGLEFVRLAGPLQVKRVIPIHNYSAALPFQGAVELRDRDLLSVKIENSSIEPPFILRGAVYDDYASGGWKAGARREVQPLFTEQHVRDGLESGEIHGRLAQLEVTVDAKSVVGSVLFAPGDLVYASEPARIDVPAGSVRTIPLNLPRSISDEEILASRVPPNLVAIGINRDQAGRALSLDAIDAGALPFADATVVRPDDPILKGESYEVTGLIRAVDPDELRAAPGDPRSYPRWLNQYLRLPPTLPQRVRALARDVAQNEPTAYDKAKAIETYLRAYPIALIPGETPPGQDTVDYFLFDAKSGFFDYHASAMAVMLRAVGVPARLAVGFAVDSADLDRDSGTYTIEDRNAYAWTEVYFPGHGWIPFNASPDRPAEISSGEDVPISAVPPVIPDDLTNIPIDPSEFLNSINGEAGAGVPSGAPGSAGSSRLTSLLWIALAVTGFLAALTLSVSLGWRRSVADLPYAQQIWEKTVRLASLAGHSPEPGQTPDEYARRLQKAFRGVPDLPLLATVYNRSRFGRKDVDGEERERLGQAWKRLRGPLLRGALGRLRPKGPRP